MNVLLPADVAAEFHRTEGHRRFGSARELLDAIETYMASKGLAKSKINRIDVADHVLHLRAVQPVVTEAEAAAFRDNVQSGTTADDLALQHMENLALAQRVRDMPMSDWSQARIDLGVTRDLASFLGGE